MAIRDIIRMGHPTLRLEAAPYPRDKIGSPEYQQLISDMQDTLEESGGIGLAAPQINESVQVVVIEVPEEGTRYGETEALGNTIYINPSIRVVNEETAGYWEGCLSVPGMMGFVERPQHIVVDYINDSNEEVQIELKEFLATVFQHELDHLFGRLYIDHIKDMSLFTYEEEYRTFHLDES